MRVRNVCGCNNIRNHGGGGGDVGTYQGVAGRGGQADRAI